MDLIEVSQNTTCTQLSTLLLPASRSNAHTSFKAAIKELLCNLQKLPPPSCWFPRPPSAVENLRLTDCPDRRKSLQLLVQHNADREQGYQLNGFADLPLNQAAQHWIASATKPCGSTRLMDDFTTPHHRVTAAVSYPKMPQALSWQNPTPSQIEDLAISIQLKEMQRLSPPELGHLTSTLPDPSLAIGSRDQYLQGNSRPSPPLQAKPAPEESFQSCLLARISSSVDRESLMVTPTKMAELIVQACASENKNSTGQYLFSPQHLEKHVIKRVSWPRRLRCQCGNTTASYGMAQDTVVGQPTHVPSTNV